MMAVGVDIGGTFTDLVGYRDGKIRLSKTLSTPADPTEGVARSLDAAGLEIAELGEFLHGSTVAINTVLERKGATTAFVTTEGFRDIYEIGRGNRPENFNIFFHRPRPLVPRDRCYELRERMNARGEILIALDQDEVRRLGARLAADGVEAVAVCLLHAYANPGARTSRSREMLRASHPQLFVTAVARDRARVPRIRAHLDHRAQRLRRPARAATISARSKRICADERFHGGKITHHALERRHDVGAARRRSSRCR